MKVVTTTLLLGVSFFSSARSQHFRFSRASPVVSVRLAREGFFQNSNRGRFEDDVPSSGISENSFVTDTRLQNSNRESFENNKPLSEISEQSLETNIRIQNDIPETRTSDNFQETDSREIQIETNTRLHNSNMESFENDVHLSDTSEHSLETSTRLQNDIQETRASESFQETDTREFEVDNDPFQSLNDDEFNNIPLQTITLASNQEKRNRQIVFQSPNFKNRFNFDLPPPINFGENTQSRSSDERTGRFTFPTPRQSSRGPLLTPNLRNPNPDFQFTLPSILSNFMQPRSTGSPIRSTSTSPKSDSLERVVSNQINQNPDLKVMIPSMFSDLIKSSSSASSIKATAPSHKTTSQKRVRFEPQSSQDGIEFEPLNLPAGASTLLGTISTSFSCEGLPYGYYADSENSCNIFHICNPVLYEDGHVSNYQYSFMCGETLVFDQQELACVGTNDITHDCKDASSYFFRNEIFGTQEEA